MGDILKIGYWSIISKKASIYRLAKGLNRNSSKNDRLYCLEIRDNWWAGTQKNKYDFLNFRKHSQSFSNFLECGNNFTINLSKLWSFVLKIDKICNGWKIDINKKQIRIIFTKG